MQTLLLIAALAVPAQQDDPPAPPTPPQRSRGGADPSDDAFRFGSPPALADDLTEEMMWPAATAEEWRSPCLVHWQRSFDDALQVAETTKRPILVAVNMDGEIASEHFAGKRYRDPDTASVMSEYVCVVASVYRHNPRDYDENGNRVPCPRFGTVTCGEHIQAERELYGQYFEGRRISPRHIVLEPDGAETYDVYYSWDVASVSKMFVAGLENRPEPVPPPEPTLENLTRSAAIDAREYLEERYAEGDADEKRRILTALLEDEALDQTEVLRAALFGLDLENAKLARRALAKCETEVALDLMAEALKVPLEQTEREVVLDGVRRMAATSTRARTLLNLHSGLGTGSDLVDAERVTAAYEHNAALAREREAEARVWGTQPAELLDLAEVLVTRMRSESGRFAAFMRADARRAIGEARAAGATGARLVALEALIADAEGDDARAADLAVEAVEGGATTGDSALAPELLEGVLALFGRARRDAIRAKYRAGEDWEAEWLSDLNGAYAVLMESPRLEVATVLEYHDFLRWLGASPRANAVLDGALARFPGSADLHDRLRRRLLWEGGPAALEAAYERLVAPLELSGEDPEQLYWFAGYASLVAAEQLRRRGRFEAAEAAYGRSLERFGRNVALQPEGAADGAEHYRALVHAALARMAMESRALDVAAERIVAALEARPASAASMDGLGITPIATAKMVEARLLDAGEAAAAGRVRAALEALPEEMLAPPPSERMGSGGRR